VLRTKVNVVRAGPSPPLDLSKVLTPNELDISSPFPNKISLIAPSLKETTAAMED